MQRAVITVQDGFERGTPNIDANGNIRSGNNLPDEEGWSNMQTVN